MFEKEAEEYLDTESKYLIEDNEGNIINIAKKVRQSFQDGAEFGYNKATQVATKDSIEVIKLRNQVLKAKELLTRFVMASVYFKGKETDLITEAEQFLKEA